jgi:hypothetical protein
MPLLRGPGSTGELGIDILLGAADTKRWARGGTTALTRVRGHRRGHSPIV